MATCLLESFFPLLWQNLSSFWNVLLKLCCTFNYSKFWLLISEIRKTLGRWRFLADKIQILNDCKAWISFCNCLLLYTCWCLSACSGFSRGRPLRSCRMIDPLSSRKMARWQLLEIPRASSIFHDLMIYIGRNADPGHTEMKSKL